ncbi:MAG TPA: GGDEF domain-containing protein, partial [Candidatus Omnitrophota bacterium]|nr:GGDEF domain-containing protein [Candidatus Omnitrophota bacterium]
RTHLFPFDQKICETVFRQQSTFQAGDRDGGAQESIRLWPDFLPFVAQPIFIHNKIFAVLIILGVEKEDVQRLSILTEGFASEAQRVKLYEKVEKLAITDGLTGMVVRRHLVERLEEEMDRARRFGFKLSFLMIDIDYFKNFNDQYGHLVGDVVLKQVSETIKKNVREIDIVGRYGGEEFGVLLVETDESGAFFVAERIRRAIADRPFRAYDENLRVTISVGCSTHSPALNDVNLLIEAADSALYQAKRQGRNRVCLSHLPNA